VRVCGRLAVKAEAWWHGQGGRRARAGWVGQSTTSCTLHDSQSGNVNKKHWDSAVVVVEDCRFARLQICRQRARAVGATAGARVSLDGHPMWAGMVPTAAADVPGAHGTTTSEQRAAGSVSARGVRSDRWTGATRYEHRVAAQQQHRDDARGSGKAYANWHSAYYLWCAAPLRALDLNTSSADQERQRPPWPTATARPCPSMTFLAK
jgi:hypothetical protein